MGTLSLVVGRQRRCERTWLQDAGASLLTAAGLPGGVKVSIPARLGLSPRSYVHIHFRALPHPMPIPVSDPAVAQTHMTSGDKTSVCLRGFNMRRR